MILEKSIARVRRGLTIGAIGVTCALLASCGGTESINFVPARILSFGDESSVITADGKKYTINGIVPDSGTPGTINCVLNPIWNQVLATSFGRTFAQCPGSVVGATPSSLILAREGATATGTRDIDFPQQITRQLAAPAAEGGGINSDDLVSVLIGVNDVVSIYERFKRGEIGSPQAIALAEQTGETIASQLNRITAPGGKVIIATVPDVSVTPYARAESLEGQAVLGALTARLNARLLVTLDNDGRKIGLIEINPYVASVVGNPGTYGFVNFRDAGCLPTAPLPDCTAATLRTDLTTVPVNTPLTAFNVLWANALQFGASAHQMMGNLASSRAHNQPFSN